MTLIGYLISAEVETAPVTEAPKQSKRIVIEEDSSSDESDEEEDDKGGIFNVPTPATASKESQSNSAAVTTNVADSGRNNDILLPFHKSFSLG